MNCEVNNNRLTLETPPPLPHLNMYTYIIHNYSFHYQLVLFFFSVNKLPIFSHSLVFLYNTNFISFQKQPVLSFLNFINTSSSSSSSFNFLVFAFINFPTTNHMDNYYQPYLIPLLLSVVPLYVTFQKIDFQFFLSTALVGFNSIVHITPIIEIDNQTKKKNKNKSTHRFTLVQNRVNGESSFIIKRRMY